MNDSSDDRISALVDGELSANEAGAVFTKLGADPRAVARWEHYQLIGDVLRGTAAAGIDRASLAARLAVEPAIIAAPRPPTQRVEARGASRSKTWLSAAAGIAAAGLVGWVALPSFWAASPAPVASAPLPSPVVKPVTVAAPVRPAVVPMAQGVEDYLLAHQRYSSSSAMQGAMPYVRIVAEEPKDLSRPSEPRQ